MGSSFEVIAGSRFDYSEMGQFYLGRVRRVARGRWAARVAYGRAGRLVYAGTARKAMAALELAARGCGYYPGGWGRVFGVVCETGRAPA